MQTQLPQLWWCYTILREERAFRVHTQRYQSIEIIILYIIYYVSQRRVNKKKIIIKENRLKSLISGLDVGAADIVL